MSVLQCLHLLAFLHLRGSFFIDATLFLSRHAGCRSGRAWDPPAIRGSPITACGFVSRYAVLGQRISLMNGNEKVQVLPVVLHYPAPGYALTAGAMPSLGIEQVFSGCSSLLLFLSESEPPVFGYFAPDNRLISAIGG